LQRDQQTSIASKANLMDSNRDTRDQDADASKLRIDPRLIEILVCPLTRTTLSYDKEKQELISKAAKLAYPIRDGIPIMLTYEARQLD
jgi:uncharacterized protein YbaR (Trm112 family)